jgi:hypothetical protein
MFLVTEAAAAAICAVFEQEGELSAAIELRRDFANTVRLLTNTALGGRRAERKAGSMIARSVPARVYNDLDTEALGHWPENGVVNRTKCNRADRPRREAILNQQAREQGLPQKVHTEAVFLRLHNDEIMPIEVEVDALFFGDPPMIAANDDDSIDLPGTDAWAWRYDEVLLQ